MGKRGLSDIITNVLIILVVLVAIGIVWGFVRPLLVNSSERISVDQYTLELEIDAQSVFINNTSKNATFTVVRGPGQGTVAGFIIVLTDLSGNKKTYSNYTNSPLNEFETKSVSFIYDLPEVSKIEIAPVFTSSNGATQAAAVTFSISVDPVTGYAGAGHSQGSSSSPGTGGPACGNGNVDAGEACDDGNSISGDGCTACAIDSGWDCSAGSPSVCLSLSVLTPNNQYFGNRTVFWWFNLSYAVSGSPDSCSFTDSNGAQTSLSCAGGIKPFFVDYRTRHPETNYNCQISAAGTNNNGRLPNFIYCPNDYNVNVLVSATKSGFTVNKSLTLQYQPCPGDFNGNGIAGSLAGVEPLPAYGSCPVGQSPGCNGDFNLDGGVNFTDQSSPLYSTLTSTFKGYCVYPYGGFSCGDSTTNAPFEECDTGTGQTISNPTVNGGACAEYTSGSNTYPGGYHTQCWPSNTATVANRCMFKAASCTGPLFCGDGSVDGDEECDPSDSVSQCVPTTPGHIKQCNSACTYDTPIAGTCGFSPD